MARNGQKQCVEVILCAIRSINPPSVRKTSRKSARSASSEKRRMSRFNAPRLLYASSKTPKCIARKLQNVSASTSRRYESGASGGACTDFPWRTCRVQGVQGVFPPKDRAIVIAAACELPARFDLPLSHFSLHELGAFIREEHKDLQISLSTIWRWLDEDALKPWQSRMWLFPRDPQFLAKATPVLDLYHGSWQGSPLGPDDYIISADEKTGMQALERRHPPVPPRPGQPQLIEHEYFRHGTVAYLAALDIRSGRVMGRVDETTGITPFMRLVDHVMRRKPYRNARRVFWIVDNGPSHHPSTFPERLATAYPNAIAVHLPIHASWINQIELYFSILQRKLLARGHFVSIRDLVDSVLRFEDRYNKTAQPFRWRFTARDLKERLKAC
jgi:hypothetical protein